MHIHPIWNSFFTVFVTLNVTLNVTLILFFVVLGGKNCIWQPGAAKMAANPCHCCLNVFKYPCVAGAKKVAA